MAGSIEHGNGAEIGSEKRGGGKLGRAGALFNKKGHVSFGSGDEPAFVPCGSDDDIRDRSRGFAVNFPVLDCG